MKSRFISIVILFLLAVHLPANSQGFVPPPEGKAAIYFVRITPFGFGISFEFFHKDKYIGAFKGTNYMRYECYAGEQLFWASSENKEFITANLKAGESYVVLVNTVIGAMKAHVSLEPIGANHPDFKEASGLILKNAPVVITQEEIDKKTERLLKKDFINHNLNLYYSEWKGKRNFRHILPEMAVPKEKL